LYICNSSASRGPITVHPDQGGQRTIVTDQCAQVNNAYGHTTIDPETLSDFDVDSFDWGYIGHGYDYCRQGESWWDPPNFDPDGGGAEIRLDTDNHDC
jgi:hypothetical protein